MKLNFKGPSPGSEREIKFRRCIKREIWHFHVVVVKKGERNVQKSVMHVRSCCFAYQTFFSFFYVLAAVHFSTRRWILKFLFRTCASAIGVNKAVKFFT